MSQTNNVYLYYRLLENVPWVATTADCWSAHNKAYLGMMAHWIDPKTHSKQHAVIAYSILQDRHTYDVLAQAMVNVHIKFNIPKAVDVIQGESHGYLGCLLPTLAVTLKKLREMKYQRLQYCELLVEAMLEGIERRFDCFFKDLDCQLAAAFHPMFRLTWLE